jgi:thioredoxin-related protein
MKVIFTALLSILFFTSLSFSTLANDNAELPLYSQHYDAKRNPFDDARAALTLAQETNRNVLMVVGGNWCAFCMEMEHFWQENKQVNQEIHRKFVILKINVSDENKNTEFMASMPPTKGYPHLYVSSATGKILLSKDALDQQVDGKHQAPLWLTFIDKWQANTIDQIALNTQ